MRMGKFFPLFLLFLEIFPLYSAWSHPSEDVVYSHQKAATLTIYPHNLGLVQDMRVVSILEGDTRLIFFDIANQFLEESLLIRSPDTASLLLKEQSFHSNPLTFQNLLEKSVGQPISAIEKNASSSGKKFIPSKLLAVSGKVALVDFGERIESISVDDIAFLTIPPSLSLHPAINALVESPQKKNTSLEITYLTKGLSWEARYTVDIHSQKNDLNITGWITLENASGIDFKRANIQLATPVNSIEGFHVSGDSTYIEPHTYPLSFPVTLHDGAHKTISFVAARNIPVSRNYRIYLPNNVHTNREGALLALPVQTWLSFKNTAKNGLGLSLPAGKIKIYARNKQESPLYVGETKTDHIPIEDPISFPLGISSKIKAETQQTDFRRLGEKVLESAYRVDLTNPTEQPITILLIQKIAGSWTLLRESHSPQSTTGEEIRWSITIPARQTISVRYRIRLTDWKE